ncbi:MAG TPA: prephenate dehydratase domain-containing protein [Gemmatimonadaceae bacterium]|nr:prephenate dehydratase domain-containing protein [Gemmatimonadaceae bacterium]
MLRVAYPGVPGAWSEDAIDALLGSDGVEPIGFATFADSLGAVMHGHAGAAVIPVFNTIVGAIGAGLDAIAAYPALRAGGSAEIAIGHCLLALPGASLRTVRRVESHAIALAQCRAFLSRQERLAVHASFDTAGAARDVSDAGDFARAAIASPRAAARYGLSVIADRIADHDDNRTRFVAVTRR